MRPERQNRQREDIALDAGPLLTIVIASNTIITSSCRSWDRGDPAKPLDMMQPGAKPVPRLCKYRSMEEGQTREYTLAILKNMELRYSAASKFNDPFDCHLDIAMRSTEEVGEMFGRAIDHAGDAIHGFFRRLGQGFRDKLEKDGKEVPSWLAEASKPPPAPRERSRWTITVEDSNGQQLDLGQVYNRTQDDRMQEFYRLLDGSFGVLCLSERPDDILLWSHYGNTHSGLCLEFDAAGHPEVFPRLRPVTYQEKYPIIPAAFPDVLEIFRDRKGGAMTELLLSVADLLASGMADTSAETPDAPDAVAAYSIAPMVLCEILFLELRARVALPEMEAGAAALSPTGTESHHRRMREYGHQSRLGARCSQRHGPRNYSHLQSDAKGAGVRARPGRSMKKDACSRTW